MLSTLIIEPNVGMEPLNETEETQRERRLLMMLSRTPHAAGRFDDQDNLIVSFGKGQEIPFTPEQQRRLVLARSANFPTDQFATPRLALIDASATETEFGSFRQGLVYQRVSTLRMWILQLKLVPDIYWRLPPKRDPKLTLQKLAATEFERKYKALLT